MHFLLFLFAALIFFIQSSINAGTPAPNIASAMSIEEKVGQLLIVHFNGETANDDAKTLINDLYIGGIIYYNWANGLTSPAQVHQLSLQLQNLAKQNHHPIPLLIAVDQEGGRVDRLTNGFTVFPGNKALAMAHDPQLTEQCAYTMGIEMKAVGVNVNLAPVVDISDIPRSIIGIRSFGETPELVTLHARQALKGYHKAGLITTLKHFPGHGAVTVDSHEDLPILNKSLEELLSHELKPFQELGQTSDMVMTAHILVPALDKHHCITLSKAALEDVLRQQIEFQGVIISDSLVMQGVLKNAISIDEAAICALEAGCDILMIGGRVLLDSQQSQELTVSDIARICNSLVLAVKSGRISEERLDQSLKRVLQLKHAYQLSDGAQPPLSCVNSKEHQQLAELIRKRSESQVSNENLMSAAKKIWNNECGGKEQNLTCWNKGENFASLGIGHFIWYPSNEKQVFKQTFPALLEFMRKRDVVMPEWLKLAKGCPWSSREAFYNDIASSKMVELRKFLLDTVHWQALFLMDRLEKSLPVMVEKLSEEKKEHVIRVFKKLEQDHRGFYALLDYVNFKGEGLVESYKGQGWGLLQVLLEMEPVPVIETTQVATTESSRIDGSSVIEDFIKAAKIVLIWRVQNAPAEKEKDEKRWLPGWLKRLDTYRM